MRRRSIGTFTDGCDCYGICRSSRVCACRIGILPRNYPGVVHNTLLYEQCIGLLSLYCVGTGAPRLLYILLDVQSLYRKNDKLKADKGRQAENEDVGGHDSRTDLYNRAYGIEKATELLRTGNSVALLLVDIDNFAEYNRLYGTEKSDEVLANVANCVKIISKSRTDITCRYESDKILVCLPVKTDKEAIVLSEEIRSAVRDMKISFPEAQRYHSVTVTVSAARGMPGDTYDDIYERAMRSQNVAKRIGGNCIAFKEHTFRPDGEK